MNQVRLLIAASCLLVLAACGGSGGSPGAVAAGPIAGTARLSGKVTAAEPFVAGQVYARNHDKNMLYMVFTNRGDYQAINLLPGGYEIWVEKGELRSEHQWMRIEAGADVKVDLQLQPGPDFPLTLKIRNRGGPEFGAPALPDVKYVSFEEVYPPGAGFDVLKANCMRCHSETFFPARRKSRPEWVANIGLMLAQNSSGNVTAAERETLTDYMVGNFGPNTPARSLKLDVDYPLDEEVLSKAMFVEYLQKLGPDTDLLKGRSTNQPGRHRAHDPLVDFEGNIWATDGIIGLSRVDPRTAQWSIYPWGNDQNNPDFDMYDVHKSDPKSIWSYIMGHGLASDSKGEIFWAELQGLHLGRLDPKTGKMIRYPADPNGEVLDEKGQPNRMRLHTPMADSKDNIWFTVIRGNKIGKWDRGTETIKLWEIPTKNAAAYGIDVDSNDEVWFAQAGGCKIGRFNPVTEAFTEYPSPTQGCGIIRLTIDSKGIVWYSVVSHGKLGRLDPATGAIVEYDILPFTEINAARPYGIISDPEDNIWFGDGGNGGALVKFDQTTNKFTYYPTPRQGDSPLLDRTREGAITYVTRSSRQSAIGVLHPDVKKMTTYAASR